MSTSGVPSGGCILVVDRDAADRRFVELGLARTGRYTLESAESTEAALELLRCHVVDLLLTEVELADGDAFQLMKRIRSRPGGKELPVIFVTKDKRGSVLAAALQAGAVDFIGKPFQLTELLARVDAVVARQRERRLDAVARSYSLAGDLVTIGFPELIHLLEIGNRDGQLFFTTERGLGEIKVQKGRIVDASFGNVQGEAAFYALMREERGRFEFEPSLGTARVQRTITAATTSLLMEGARQLDMHKRDAGGPKKAAAQPTAADLELDFDADEAGDAGHRTLPRAARATPELAKELAAVVADPFSLGTIRFCNRTQLVELTTAAAANGRCFGCLVAPPLSGVSLFAGMAAPLGEADIASALEWDQRVLLLTFAAASGASLDVVLLDCTFPAMVLDDMRCGASFIVYAPPRGDHLALPHHTLGEIVSTLGHLRPDVLVGLGNATIDTSLRHVCGAANIDPRMMIVHRPIEDPGTDLRQHLVGMLERWGAAEQVAR